MMEELEHSHLVENMLTSAMDAKSPVTYSIPVTMTTTNRPHLPEFLFRRSVIVVDETTCEMPEFVPTDIGTGDVAWSVRETVLPISFS